MSEVLIAKCTCEHKFQDKQYGNGMRVMNPIIAKGTMKAYRCTICEKEIFNNESKKV